MAEQAARAATRDVAAAVERLAKIGAGLHGTVLNARSAGLGPREIGLCLGLLADPEDVRRALTTSGGEEGLRELVERYTARELTARWSG